MGHRRREREGLLFRHGKVVKQVPQEAMVEELMALIETL